MIVRPKCKIAIAAFDSLASVEEVLDALKTRGVDLTGAALLAANGHALLEYRAEIPKDARATAEVVDPPNLCFLPFKPALYCTMGPLASALEQRRDRGARRLAAALKPWLQPHRVDALEYQLGRGRILLWFRITDLDHYGIVCGEMVRASPHLVEVCDECI